MLARDAEQGRGLDDEKWTKPLAGAEARIAHGLEQPRRPAELVLGRRRFQEPIDENIDVLCHLIEAILELLCCVHTVLVAQPRAGPPVYAGREAFSSPRLSNLVLAHATSIFTRARAHNARLEIWFSRVGREQDRWGDSPPFLLAVLVMMEVAFSVALRFYQRTTPQEFPCRHDQQSCRIEVRERP